MKTLLLSLTLLLTSVVHAQSDAAGTQAWRCGADGRSYSDQPCANGRAVAVGDSRGAAERAQAQEVVARERALAKQLVAERHEREREAAQRGSGLIAIKPIAAPPTPKATAKDQPKKLKTEKPKKQKQHKPHHAAAART
jgi:hypothetical protein